ncbi:kinase [Planococcus beigongshangi]|uniref:kinase n=1 Tax=Planococcus beigongshangi TaxID=2782536 RepID=UPI00193BC1E7|nr:kinase [Planococcus beigongshangi]
MKDMMKRIIDNLSPIENGRRLIIGIDGMSRSGKTTLAGELKRQFENEGVRAVIFHLDDLIVERARRYGTGEEEWLEYYGLQWETGWLREHFFKRLKTEDELTLPFYDGQADRHECREISLPDSGVIIIEGVFLQRPEWRGFCDYVIYVDSPRQRRIEREAEVVQHNREKFENRYWPAEEYYEKVEEPQTRADLIVRN